MLVITKGVGTDSNVRVLNRDGNVPNSYELQHIPIGEFQSRLRLQLLYVERPLLVQQHASKHLLQKTAV
jgi:hypothetical protein